MPAEQTTEIEALHKILAWCEAYPEAVFPEPDLGWIKDQIGAGAMSALHAHWARHLLDGIARYAREGLKDA